MSTKINCQVTGCTYVVEHESEAVAIAMLTSHSQNHKGNSSPAATSTKQKVPKIDRPEVKQDISDEDWQSFEAEWRRFKRCTEMRNEEVADQLFQCCEKSLKRLLLKENPDVIEAGEDTLIKAMKRMAVLHVATSVRRTNLLSARQDHGQTFREFFANVRAAAATCEYSIKCPHECCNEKSPVDYSPMVIKDILIAGIEDSEIMKDVLGMAELDAKSDRDIVKFVEEKELARNALQATSSTNALSSYNKSRRNDGAAHDDSAIKKKLSMRGKCASCHADIALYKQYQNGRFNKDAFKVCVGCYKKEKKKTPESKAKEDASETVAIMSFISSLDLSEEESCRETAHKDSNIACTENVEVATTWVNVCISGPAHSKFGRCKPNDEFYPIDELAISGDTLTQCVMGPDMLPKLGCRRSMLVKGRVFISLESGNQCLSKVVTVDENATGLHLDAKTVDELNRSGQRGDEGSAADGCTCNEVCAGSSHVILDHHIFTPTGWSKVPTLRHPQLRIRITTDKSDYDRMNIRHPTIAPKSIDVVADSGAQSCLWSRKEFLSSGFSMKDLIPVRHTMRAANRASINIDGAILLRLSGMSAEGSNYEAASMVYISPDANSFFLSKDAMVQLGVISHSFPQIGATHNPESDTVNSSEISEPDFHVGSENADVAPCGCMRRQLPPGKPKQLPFECTFDNAEKMEKYILDRWDSSTFNQCPHQMLPVMEGPPVSFHVADDSKPTRVTTPAPVALHWQERVKAELDRDVNLGVLERVPYGEATDWCTRMVITRKHDGGPRRTIDLSPLNQFCKRETHPSKSPFHLARSVPQGSVKTVFDAWNGFHSVLLREEDRHYTTFITPWGLYRYKRVPQGFVSSGDGYNRRFDDILAHITRLVRCVDDSLLHDTTVEEHWWRVMEFMEVAGHAGVILNPGKFQFSKKTVDFAGFRITEDAVEPLPKYLDAIREYPTPRNITDMRSWFGLVNQVSHYSQLCDIMEPFKKFLSPKVPFEWNDELDSIFNQSKSLIVEAIKEGVQIFDPTRRTALMTDWSKTGIGFWLLQKHCECRKLSPGCCQDGWRITLAGSRFLSSAERNYAPIEGEALGVAWSLEQTRFFTMGCDELLVVVDHKPLIKLLGDRRLDEINNPRLFRLKQRTLMWKFQMEYQPGVHNHFADAVSRRPNRFAEMSSIDMQEDEDIMEELIVAGIGNDLDRFYAVTWDVVKSMSENDPSIRLLASCVTAGFPSKKSEMPSEIAEYWDHRHGLNVVDSVVLYNDRIVIPVALRERVLDNLHSAHQGVTSMSSRALATVFWPGITASIEMARSGCRTCHRNAPSQAKLPPNEPELPKAPFEKVCGDFFKLGGYYYLVVVDRLSGWPEVVQVKSGTVSSGAKGLCQALRRIFATFGVPEEIGSDGGPEFVAVESKDFYHRWGIKHRLSSAYFPQSNGRAELAVKSIKRLLEDNVGPNGELNTDKVVCALLQQRNTPDRDCQLSPAQVLFGRPLRDGIPQLQKSTMIFDNDQIFNVWHEYWASKENALRTRLVKNCERLEANSKDLEPLREGDSVLIQNQVPNSPRSKKWDRQGTVVATGEHDQYLVRVAGTGRLTLRNRRFLRRFQEQSGVPRSPDAAITRLPEAPKSEKISQPSSNNVSNPCQRNISDNAPDSDSTQISPSSPPPSPPPSPLSAPRPPLTSLPSPQPSNPVQDMVSSPPLPQPSSPVQDMGHQASVLPPSQQHEGLSRAAEGEVLHEPRRVVSLPSEGDTSAGYGGQSVRRSTRVKKATQFYDACSGR